MDAVLGYLPEPVLSIAAKLPVPGALLFRKYIDTTDDLTRQLMRQKRENEASEMDRSFIGQFGGFLLCLMEKSE